ncbi:MAG: DUF1624 domain-containing protein [Firmicutes bacterium]|nr:DUF1624 domain-containing protein [Bacillota bacterium]
MKHGRFWEIDALRGLAIVMMGVYHLAWDLNYFGLYRGNVAAGLWVVFQKATAVTFVSLVGVSLWLNYSRKGRVRFAWYLSRGLKILCWGIVVTLTTWNFPGKGTILFGVLHLIGVSIICAYPFLRLGNANLVLGLIFIAMGCLLARATVNSPWLIWLGLSPFDLYMVDYVPFFPWFGVVLLGIYAGYLAYPEGLRRLRLKEPTPPLARLFSFLGRHSLTIYLTHQPVFLGLLFLKKCLTPQLI